MTSHYSHDDYEENTGIRKHWQSSQNPDTTQAAVSYEVQTDAYIILTYEKQILFRHTSADYDDPYFNSTFLIFEPGIDTIIVTARSYFDNPFYYNDYYYEIDPKTGEETFLGYL